MAAAARDNVVHLDEAGFARYASGARRPYHLVVFLTASHLLDKTQLGLRELRQEFGLLAQVQNPQSLVASHQLIRSAGHKGKFKPLNFESICTN